MAEAEDDVRNRGQESDRADARAGAAVLARDLVRSAWKATLATVSRAGGHPYGSLVAISCQPDGSPLLLLSGLAEHTRNLVADQRASVLIDGTSRGPGALTGPRVTLVGRIEEATGPTDRARYLARHPDAAGFIEFADFKLYALKVEWAHLVAGFGRIVTLPASDVVIAAAGAEEVIAAEASILDHMNADHSDAIGLLARQATDTGDSPDSVSGGDAAAWRMTGCDTEGFDLARGNDALRLRFPTQVKTAAAVREALAGMVRQARATTRAGR